MSYKAGHCAQCGTQVMVRDIAGRFSSMKSNWCQIDLVFSDGHRMRATMCKDCRDNIDYQKIMDNVTGKDSRAARRDVLDGLKERGLPVSFQNSGQIV